MPEKKTLARARQDKRQGKAPSTQAGEFVREEMDHIRAGKHGARNAKQAIAIGLSKARKSGIAIPSRGRKAAAKPAIVSRPSSIRSKASLSALKSEGRRAASPTALSRQAKQVAAKRGPVARSVSAQRALRTKGAQGVQMAAKKAANTRARKAA